MMDDLRTKLQLTSQGFGEPRYTLDHLEGLKKGRERRTRIAAIVVASAIAALSGSFLLGAFGETAPETRAADPGSRNGRISFVVGEPSGSMEGFQLATAEPDGSNRQTLIDGLPEYLTGGWSPDGSTIVFSRGRGAAPDGHIHIWRMNADGSNLEQLTHGDADDYDAQFSPDGTRILFRRTGDGRLPGTGSITYFGAPAIFVMNADGSGVRHVRVEPNQLVLGARWSPDEEILFIADTQADDGREGLGIYVVRSDGTDLRRIIRGQNGTPQWAPDGERILFQAGSRLVTVDGEGLDPRVLVEGLDRDVHFCWSPDGEQILYVRPAGPGQGNELWVTAADGSHERRFAENLEWPDATATWSRDGKVIAFVRDGDIWTVDVESGAEQQVTDTSTYESMPAWGAADAS
jgi:Tol biopolymer transport system component